MRECGNAALVQLSEAIDGWMSGTLGEVGYVDLPRMAA